MAATEPRRPSVVVEIFSVWADNYRRSLIHAIEMMTGEARGRVGEPHGDHELGMKYLEHASNLVELLYTLQEAIDVADRPAERQEG